MGGVLISGHAKPQWPVAALACLGALAAATLVIIPAASLNGRAILAGVAGLLCLAGAYLSGNARLYCLWWLMLTIPFDLSKRFGPVIEKMGGETSFRAELSDPFLAVLAAFIAWEIWTGRRPGLRVPKVAYIWLLIMLMGAWTVVFGHYRTTAAHEVVRMGKVLLLFLVVANELRSLRKILHCAGALTLSLMLQSVTGLVQQYTGKFLGLAILGETPEITAQQLSVDSVQGETVFRVGAFLQHPNLFGIFLAALLPLAIGGFLLRSRKSHRLFFLAGVFLGVPALIATLSRSGWVSFAVSTVVLLALLVFHQGLRPRVIAPAAVALAAVVIICALYAGPISKRIFESKSGALMARAELEEDARTLIGMRPWLGWDLNSYAFNIYRVMHMGPRSSHKMWGNLYPVVHNIFLLWWAETGVVGLLLHLAVWAGIILVGIRNLAVRSEALFIVNAACLSGIVAFIPDGFYSFSLRMNAILRVFWVLAGIVMAIRYLDLQSRRENLPEPGDERNGAT
jgi:O-antigen ligase